MFAAIPLYHYKHFSNTVEPSASDQPKCAKPRWSLTRDQSKGGLYFESYEPVSESYEPVSESYEPLVISMYKAPINSKYYIILKFDAKDNFCFIGLVLYCDIIIQFASAVTSKYGRVTEVTSNSNRGNRVTEVTNNRKIQIKSVESGRGRLGEVVAYERFGL